MNNLDIVLALFTTPNNRFSRLDRLDIQRLHFKPQQVHATSNRAELFPTIKPMSSTSKTILNSYD